MVKGLSHGISILCEDVQVLRADIAVSPEMLRINVSSVLKLTHRPQRTRKESDSNNFVKPLRIMRISPRRMQRLSLNMMIKQSIVTNIIAQVSRRFKLSSYIPPLTHSCFADGIVTYLNSAPRPMRQDSIVSTSSTLVAYADHENTYVLPVTIWIPAPHPDHDDHAKLTWPPLSSPHFLLREDHTRVISAKVAVPEQDQTGYHSPASKAPRRQAITHTCSRLSSTKGRRRVCRKASSRTPSGENSSRSKDLGHLRYDLQSTSADIDEWEDIDDEVALTLAHYSLRGVASQLYNETAVSGSDNVL